MESTHYAIRKPRKGKTRSNQNLRQIDSNGYYGLANEVSMPEIPRKAIRIVWEEKTELQVSSVLLKDPDTDDVVVHTYVHLFDYCSQDWYAVVSVLEDLLEQLKKRYP